MLRITHSGNAAGAAQYFDEGLSQGDYYVGKESAVGVWGGQAARRLGLFGAVGKEEFVGLVRNRKPDGEKLNPRDSQTRKVGYDFTFSVSKSVSLVALGDERIREAFEASVEETMRELEHDIRTQDGQGKQKRLVKTQEMIWASFTHTTSRPIDAVADPHLHRHCFAINSTWNESKGRFQAAEFSTIKRAAPYYEAAFDSRLAMRMQGLGYGIERRGLSWEVVGIGDETLRRFSRRTQEIEKAARLEKMKSGELSVKQKAQLGALTRSEKTGKFTSKELKAIWRSRLTPEEIKQVDSARHRNPVIDEKINAAQAVARAEAHLFERKSVVKSYQLKAEALKRSFGQLLPEEVSEQVNKTSYFRKEIKDQIHLTTAEALAEEKKMLAYVRRSKGMRKPIHPTYKISNPILSEEQKQAVMHALSDKNKVTLISGGAGTGKTTLMKEVQKGVKESGMAFHAFAPTTSASRGTMVKEGFEGATTLASLLSNPETQNKVKDGYIWIDESGLLGVKDMNRLFEISKKQNAQLLLTGDTRQHSSVAAGDALRILERDGGVKVARVNKIQRQRNNPRFKQVVAFAAKGRVDKALHHLDRQGGVVEEENGAKRLAKLVEDYGQSVKRGESSLIISPTHMEGRDVTQALRARLKEMGVVKKTERDFVHYKTGHQTQEQKRDAFHYQSSAPLMVEFHQNAKGFAKGERWQVEVKSGDDVRLKRDGMNKALPVEQSNRFTLYRQKELKLAVGDKIRITKNTKTQQGTRIHNGSIYRITGFAKGGDIKLHTGKTLDKGFGHLDYGYTQTSYSAQGATVDRVFIAQSSQSFGATSQQQLYVSLSRARQGAKIYTDDKRELERAVMRDGKRMTAREVAEFHEVKQRQNSVSNQYQNSQTQSQSKSYGKELTL